MLSLLYAVTICINSNPVFPHYFVLLLDPANGDHCYSSGSISFRISFLVRWQILRFPCKDALFQLCSWDIVALCVGVWVVSLFLITAVPFPCALSSVTAVVLDNKPSLARGSFVASLLFLWLLLRLIFVFGVLWLSLVQSLSRLWLFATPWTAAHHSSCLSLPPRAHSNSCLLSQWCHPTISFSVTRFSSCLQSFPETGSFPVSQFFTSGGQSIGVSVSASVLPMNVQDLFPLGWTGWISLQSKGLSRVFSNTTVQKHQYFSTQFSLWFNSYIHMWLLEEQKLWLDGSLLKK